MSELYVVSLLLYKTLHRVAFSVTTRKLVKFFVTNQVKEVSSPVQMSLVFYVPKFWSVESSTAITTRRKKLRKKF